MYLYLLMNLEKWVKGLVVLLFTLSKQKQHVLLGMEKHLKSLVDSLIFWDYMKNLQENINTKGIIFYQHQKSLSCPSPKVNQTGCLFQSNFMVF